MTDRTINNSRFNIDRDFGLQVYYLKNNPDRFGYEIKTAISTGEGRNWTQTSDNKMAYTGRVELYPLGNFTKGGAYFEGDLMRETTPKFMLSGTYHFNQGALRTQGQQGNELFEPLIYKGTLQMPSPSILMTFHNSKLFLPEVVLMHN